ncbi:MAG: hypothetical protein LBJ20_03745 [Candidatus Methanoplasma sp.]|nr:hypothetical protein [Candidatus Methanoplasma sp.]
MELNGIQDMLTPLFDWLIPLGIWAFHNWKPIFVTVCLIQIAVSVIRKKYWKVIYGVAGLIFTVAVRWSA